MKVALVFFAYSGDEDLLNMAVQAVPRLRAQGHVVDCYVLDDAASPLDMPPKGCRYWRTEWPRMGNLNGVECIVGMVEEYAAIFATGGYDWVVKADCDTFVNSFDWLEVLDAREVAFAGTVHVSNYCSGACYAVSRGAVKWLREKLQDRMWRGKAERGHCEDKVLCNMCRVAPGMRVHALDGRVGGVTGKLCHAWQGEPLPFEELREAYAVDFKACRWNSPPDRWEDDAVQAVEQMSNYVKEIAKNG